MIILHDLDSDRRRTLVARDRRRTQIVVRMIKCTAAAVTITALGIMVFVWCVVHAPVVTIAAGVAAVILGRKSNA